jgi:dipeptidyl aminopeptidase/acylaminoacyl peptidase
MFKPMVLAAAMMGLAGMAGGASAQAKGETPLIPFERFFAPAEYQAPLISPDGKWVSYIGRYQNAFNILVAPIGDMAKARPVTKEVGRGIQWYSVSGAVTYRWTPDSRYILYLKDNNGDEKNRIWATDVQTGAVRNLTPGDNVRSHILAVSATHPGHVLAAVDTAHPTANPELLFGYDVVDIDLASGERRVVMHEIPYAGVIADNDFKVRLVWNPSPDLGIDILKLKADGGAAPFYHIAYVDLGGLQATGQTDSARISADNRTLYMLDDVGRDTVAVVGLDLETGVKTVIAKDDRVDIRDVLFDPATHAVAAYGVNWTKLVWRALDPKIQGDLDLLQARGDGVLRIASVSADGRTWLVNYSVADQPDAYYAFDARTHAMKKLFVTTPALLGLPLVKMFPYVIKSRDGLDLVGYYLLPFSVDPKQTGKPTKPAPMVVYVHGGPGDERPEYAYAPLVQYVANRGYGFLYVDFRGGPGFGKAFLNGADMQWGDKMHDDVLDQVRWAIGEGLADPKRVAILGGSYGGYETLVAMTKSPEVFACGVDVVGPSDLSIPLPHWDPNWMAKALGDPRTEAGRAMLRARSPFYLAAHAKNPLLIGQGDQDSRVPTAQSDKMVKVMQAAGAPVVYLRFPDEGHGFLRPENNFAFWATTEIFLAKCLGGRSQPLTPSLFKGSSVIVAAGGDYIPGLEAAVAAAHAAH